MWDGIMKIVTEIWKDFSNLTLLEKWTTVFGVVTTCLSIVIFVIQKIEVRYRKRVEYLHRIVQDIRQNNYQHTQTALDYYTDFYRARPEKDMVVSKTVYQRGWLYKKSDGEFLELDKVNLNILNGPEEVWKSKKNEKPSFLPTPKEGYAENAKLHCGVNLLNLPAYALAGVKIDSHPDAKWPVTLDVRKGKYFDFYDTCAVLEAEMAYEYGIRKKSCTKFKGLKMRNRHGDLLELDRRFAGIGVNVLTIFQNVQEAAETEVPDYHTYFLLHRRSETKVAEGCGKLHVIPAGSYQPAGLNIPVIPESCDYNLENTAIREFCEELLGLPEFEQMSNSNLLKSLNAKAYFLGVCFEPVNTKTEILACMVIDVKECEQFKTCNTVQKLQQRLKNNYEGKVSLQRLDMDHVKQYMDDPRSTPAFAQIMEIVQENHAFFGVEQGSVASGPSQD